MCDVIIARISRGMFPALAAIFLLALDYTLQLRTRLCLTTAVYEDFVELRNIEMSQEVLKISWL